MKINIILPFTVMTGGIKVILEYANGLVTNGHDVICYTPMLCYKFDNVGIKGFLKRVKATIDNTIVRGSKINWFDLKANIKLVPYISDKYIRDADVVIATAWPTAKSANKLSCNKGKKVYFIQGYEVWSGSNKEVTETYKYNFEKIVISKSLANILEKELGVVDTKVIYNGIDMNVFYNDNNIEQSSPVISIMYHTSSTKGYLGTIRVIEDVKKYYPNVKVKIFGTEVPQYLEEYMEFYYRPSKEILRNIYSTSDLYLTCSENEGWGLTPIEAMACGTVVVGTNVGCLNELGIDNYNCLVSNIGNYDKLVSDCIKILGDIELRRYILNNAYKTIESLKWDKSIEKFEEIITSL